MASKIVWSRYQYHEEERGRFDATLFYDDYEIAHTSGDVIVAYDKAHQDAINEWADYYEYEVEWMEEK